MQDTFKFVIQTCTHPTALSARSASTQLDGRLTAQKHRLQSRLFHDTSDPLPL